MRVAVTFDESTPDTFRGKVAGCLARLPYCVTLDGHTLTIETQRHLVPLVLADMRRAFMRADEAH